MNRLVPAAVSLAMAATAAAARGDTRDGLPGAASCTLSSTPLAFGHYSPLSAAPSDFTATVTVTCGTSSPQAVTIDGQLSLIGDPAERRLTSHDPLNGKLRYRLYLDPARSILWGDGSGSGRAVPVVGTASAGATFRRSVTIYGRLLARQRQAPTGQYGDDIQIAFDF